MNKQHEHHAFRLAISTAIWLCSGWVAVSAQETSLFKQPPLGASAGNVSVAPSTVSPGVTAGVPTTGSYGRDSGLSAASWTFAAPPTPRSFRIHDIVTIRVDELARSRADGNSQVRRNTLYDAILQDWIAFRDGDLGTDAQSTGDPRVNVQSNQLFRAQSSVESRETLAFNIAARVVDIQPNGNLVLEARKTIWNNDNTWETALTGICRAQDIAPDNVILSRDLVDLQIRKNEKGQLRDGYKRGWLTRWIDEFNPF